MSEAPANLLVEKADGVLTVRLDRPERRNALSREALAELGRTFSAHADDADLKVAVLTASGDKAFAAGGDLKDFDAVRSEAEADALFRLANESLDAIRRFPLPTVAALNGTAIGGGAELAVACDFRVAAPHATVGFVQGRLAITSGFGGGTDLMRLLGSSRALLHMLRAETLSADEARTLGLVDQVAAPDVSLDACVARFIAPILRLPVQVARALKSLAFAERAGLPAEERERLERHAFSTTWAHPDHWSALERALSRKR